MTEVESSGKEAGVSKRGVVAAAKPPVWIGVESGTATELPNASIHRAFRLTANLKKSAAWNPG